MPYRIVRYYQDRSTPNRVLRRNLTLEQARAHCSNPESSSRTCTSKEGRREAQKLGTWYDGFREEGKSPRPLNRKLMEAFKSTWETR